MSENLTKLAQKIDFCGKDEGAPAEKVESKEKDSEEGDTSTSTEGTFKSTPAWPWESIRNKLRYLFSEWQ